MPSEPRWLTPDEIIEINAAAVAETGEPFFLRDRGLLESAAHRPIDLFQYGGVTELAPLAVTLMLGIARNHPFEQGNKRTGFGAAGVFIAANGYELALPDEPALAEIIIQAITGEVVEETLTELFRSSIIAG